MILNPTVIELIKEYPTDGTHPYNWPKTGPFDGVTRNLVSAGVTIAKANSKKETYCSGLGFEVWFRAMQKVGAMMPSPFDLKEIKRDWFVARPGQRMGPVDALVPRGLGVRIFPEALIAGQEPMEGDFIQLWRKDGSGHQVINKQLLKKLIHYWATQPATKGIGFRKESRDEVSKNPVVDIFIVRAQIK